MLIGDLERKLLGAFPPGQAEPWDRTGMLVGDPSEPLKAVAVSLDPTLRALRLVRERGANALVTHHPMFLEPPESVRPPVRGGEVAGSRIWEAVSNGVSVMSFHTALDASPSAADALARPLGLVPDGLLEPMPGHPGCGYGRICRCNGISLGELAKRCGEAFGRPVRVWGDDARLLASACLWTGAAGSSPRACNERGVDVLVCGEVKYHEALDACEAGLAIVELGHDVSEQVLCGVLVESIRLSGVPSGDIHLLEPPVNWR